jgi:hypothetical protein
MNPDLYDSHEVTIDLSDPDEFTIEGVRRLLASKRGFESLDEYPVIYQLRVTRNGIAYIKDNWEYPTDSEWQNHAIMFETWHRSYVGKDAANTDWWVNHVYNMLKGWWDRCEKDGPHRLGDAIFADYMP